MGHEIQVSSRFLLSHLHENKIIDSIDPTVTFNRHSFKFTYKLRSIKPINSIFNLKNKK